MGRQRPRADSRHRAAPGALVAAALLLAVTAATAQSDRSPAGSGQFACLQELRGPKQAGYCALLVPREVFAYCLRRDLADLRVLDKQGREVPYVLVRPRDYAARASAVPATIRNLSYVPGLGTRFEVQRAANAPLLKALTITSPLPEFCCSVMVEGSADRRRWAVLRRRATLYAFTGDNPARGETISFPPTDYAFLRVTVLSRARRFPVTRVSVAPELKSAWPLQQLASGPMSVNLVPDRKVTEVSVDLGLPDQPLDAVELHFRDRNVLRWCDLHFRDKAEDDWSAGPARQALFRYQTRTLSGEQNRFASGGVTARYVQMVVHNGDDTPLEITGLRAYAYPWLLVTKWDPAAGLRLYFGASEVVAPQYDLAEYLRRDYPDQMAGRRRWAVTLKAGDLQANPEYQVRPPWTEGRPWLLYVGMALGVVVLGAILWRTMRQIAPEPQ